MKVNKLLKRQVFRKLLMFSQGFTCQFKTSLTKIWTSLGREIPFEVRSIVSPKNQTGIFFHSLIIILNVLAGSLQYLLRFYNCALGLSICTTCKNLEIICTTHSIIKYFSKMIKCKKKETVKLFLKRLVPAI